MPRSPAVWPVPPHPRLCSAPGYRVIPSKFSLLVVDDDPAILTAISQLIGREFDVRTAGSAEEAQAILAEKHAELLLADQALPGITGVQLLEWARERFPQIIRMLMTGHAQFEDVVDAINCGQVYRYVYKPFRSEDLLQVLRSASRAFQLERSHEDLLEELRQLNLELEGRVDQRTRELQDANHQLQQQNLMLQRLALTDSLTGLPNRRAIDQLIRAELRRRARYPSTLALGIVDVDHFREINSRYLLPAGDQVLASVAKTFVASLRTVDTIGRIGGDEFMVVAPETELAGAAALAERIRVAVEASRYRYKDASISITVSVAFAVTDLHSNVDYEAIKHAAALGLQEAKSTGRNKCVIRIFQGRLQTGHTGATESAEGGH
jgi:diguanylate cyclase